MGSLTSARLRQPTTTSRSHHVSHSTVIIINALCSAFIAQTNTGMSTTIQSDAQRGVADEVRFLCDSIRLAAAAATASRAEARPAGHECVRHQAASQPSSTVRHSTRAFCCFAGIIQSHAGSCYCLTDFLGPLTHPLPGKTGREGIGRDSYTGSSHRPLISLL